MRAIAENRLHTQMLLLLLASLVLDALATRHLPAWNMPSVGLLTLVVAMCWIGLFTAYRTRGLHDQVRVLRDRVERTQQLLEGLEDDLRQRRTLPRN